MMRAIGAASINQRVFGLFCPRVIGLQVGVPVQSCISWPRTESWCVFSPFRPSGGHIHGIRRRVPSREALSRWPVNRFWVLLRRKAFFFLEKPSFGSPRKLRVAHVWHTILNTFVSNCLCDRRWATNGARTRDLRLGKPPLCQLSYCRNCPL